MSTLGPITLTTAANASAGEILNWSIPGAGAVASINGDTFAFSNYLCLTGGDFSALPDGATIDGVKFTLTRQADTDGVSDNINDLAGLIIIGNVVQTGGTNITHGVWPTIATAQDYGGVAEKWGVNPTAAQVKAAGFGFAVQMGFGELENNAYVQAITATITYTEAPASSAIPRAGSRRLQRAKLL